MTSKVKVNTIETESGSTLTLGKSGDTVTLASGASQSGFGREGSVDWQTSIKTANFTAANGEGYFCNTSGGAFTVTLPSASVGNIVSIKDYSGTFQTNNLTITPNGSDKIDGINGSATISTENAALTLVYADSTRGWLNVNDSTNVEGAAYITATGGTITTVCTNYKVHTFTSPGTFCVTGGAGPLAIADYMVIAGGGGGAGHTSSGSGAGGAGGFRESKCSTTSGCWTASPLASSTSLPISVQAYPITVGAGGAGSTSGSAQNGAKGSNSIFSTITSTGGGGGVVNPADPNSTPGGSGGGSFGSNPAGTGNTPPTTPPQGNPGGTGHNSPNYTGGGGGGATGAGQNGTNPSGGNGGAGATSSINATPTARAGGGGGGMVSSGGSTPGLPAGCGTAGGGDGGGPGSSDAATAGTANTGGGGGGGGAYPAPASAGGGGAGGSGVVIIRYRFQ